MINTFQEHINDSLYNPILEIVLESVALSLYNDTLTIDAIQTITNQITESLDETPIHIQYLVDEYPDVFEKVWNTTTESYNYTLTQNGNLLVEEDMLLEFDAEEAKAKYTPKIKQHFKKHWKKYAAGAAAAAGGAAIGYAAGKGVGHSRGYTQARADHNTSHNFAKLKHMMK